MASSIIRNKNNRKVKVSQKEKITKISNIEEPNSIISDILRFESFPSEKEKIVLINDIRETITTPSSILPFRVRFNNVMVRNYPSLAQPIGIAIIGLSNYIL